MKKILLFVLAMVMMLTSVVMFLPAMEVEAETTYDFLFPVKNGRITQAYGNNGHGGMDIGTSGDDTIYAAKSGTVIWCKNPCWHWNSWDSKNGVWRDEECRDSDHERSYGNVIGIQHDDGTVAIYGHLTQEGFGIFGMYKGKEVNVGEPIGYMGASGKSDGKHLHFEFRAFNGWGNYTGSKINVNSITNGGLVNYSYYGYSGQATITPATITEGTYNINNGGFIMRVVNDANGSGTIGMGSSGNATLDAYKFNIQKEGSYYKIYPTSIQSDRVLNCYWGSGGTQTLNGNEVTLWNNSGNPSQRWVFEKYGNGYLIHPADRQDLSITREDLVLYVKTTTKADNQIWTLDPPECSHTYDNACDTTCNKCGETRSTTHTYDYKRNDNQHWQECLVCGSKKSYENHNWEFVYANNGEIMGTVRIHLYGCSVCDKVKLENHVYDNDCDPLCNICNSSISKRDVSCQYSSSYEYNGVNHWQTCVNCGGSVMQVHIYANDCDKNCDVCGYTRSVAGHKYDNDCDTTCNNCGKQRTINHTYDNACDKQCNVCNSMRSVEHEYDNPCDAVCNICGTTRTVAGHSYSNSCAAICNLCGYTRETSHVFDGEYDKQCNECGFVRQITVPDKDEDIDDDEDLDYDMDTVVIAIIVAAVGTVSVIVTAIIDKKKH